MFILWIVALCVWTSIAYGSERDLGPVEILGEIGKLSAKYQHLTAVDLEASNTLRYFAESFRIFFPSGFGYIPALDPYFNPTLQPAIIDSNDIKGKIEYYNFELQGAKDFIIATIEARLYTGRVDFIVEFPKLSVKVDYAAKFQIDNAPLDFSAHVNLTYYGVKVIGALSVIAKPPGAPTNDQKFSIVACHYNFTSEDTKYNLNSRGLRSRYIGPSNTLLQIITKQIAEQSSQAAAESSVNVLNKILEKFTAAQVIALLLSNENQRNDTV